MIPIFALVASASLAASPAPQNVRSEKMQAQSPVTLGYVLLYVNDVAASLDFYERAFGLSRRMFNDDGGKAYGELETGAARLAFVSLTLVEAHLKQEVVVAKPSAPPLGFEIALVTAEVPALYERAVKAGAAPVQPPETKPWGQIVAYVRDANGFIVELCTPLP
jgi:lactoylglutathione lyase